MFKINKTRGRPKKKESLDKVVHIRMNSEEYHQLKVNAENYGDGKSVSEFARDIIFGRIDQYGNDLLI